MGRKHIHMTTSIDQKTVVSGIRQSSSAFVFVDVKAAIFDGVQGIPFFLSENGVILSPGNKDGIIPVKYLTFKKGSVEAMMYQNELMEKAKKSSS